MIRFVKSTLIIHLLFACMVIKAQNRTGMPDTTIPDSIMAILEPPAVESRPDSSFWSKYGYFRFGVSLFDAEVSGNSNNTHVAGGLAVVPGLRLQQNKNAMLTISAPISFAVFRIAPWMLDAPIMADLHLGAASVNNTTSKFGLIAGVGLDYYIASGYSDGYVKTTGIRYEGGLVIRSKNSLTTILCTYQIDAHFSNVALYGITLQGILPTN